MGTLNTALSIVDRMRSTPTRAPLAVTTNNLANANTPGYDRQIAQFQRERSRSRWGTLIFGSGVTLEQAQTGAQQRASAPAESGDADFRPARRLRKRHEPGRRRSSTRPPERDCRRRSAPSSQACSSFPRIRRTRALRVGVILAAQNLATAFNQVVVRAHHAAERPEPVGPAERQRGQLVQPARSRS